MNSELNNNRLAITKERVKRFLDYEAVNLNEAEVGFLCSIFLQLDGNLSENESKVLQEVFKNLEHNAEDVESDLQELGEQLEEEADKLEEECEIEEDEHILSALNKVVLSAFVGVGLVTAAAVVALSSEISAMKKQGFLKNDFDLDDFLVSLNECEDEDERFDIISEVIRKSSPDLIYLFSLFSALDGEFSKNEQRLVLKQIRKLGGIDKNEKNKINNLIEQICDYEQKISQAQISLRPYSEVLAEIEELISEQKKLVRELKLSLNNA